LPASLSASAAARRSGAGSARVACEGEGGREADVADDCVALPLLLSAEEEEESGEEGADMVANCLAGWCGGEERSSVALALSIDSEAPAASAGPAAPPAPA
jgi:hypothetical protein